MFRVLEIHQKQLTLKEWLPLPVKNIFTAQNTQTFLCLLTHMLSYDVFLLWEGTISYQL